jgi:uncharacterized protein YjdB
MPHRLLPCVSLVLLAACSDGPVATSGRPALPLASSQVATVNVTPFTALLTVGDTIRLRAATLDAGGTVLAGRVVAWSTESATSAAVSTTGLVTAVAPGSVRISALSEGRTGQATLTILAR